MGWVRNRMVPKLVRTRPAALLGMGGSLCRISAACVETLFTTIELTGGRFLLARGKTIATVARAEETVLPRHPGARVSGVEIRSRLRIFQPATAVIRIECADLALTDEEKRQLADRGRAALKRHREATSQARNRALESHPGSVPV